jgi:rhomboid protease GluP
MMMRETPPLDDQLFAGPPPPPQVQVQVPQRQPVVVYAIMGITILVYLLQQVWFTSDGYPMLVLWGAKINEFIVQGQLWRLFTPMLLHGPITHIFFNMYALYSIGRSLEVTYGHGRFLLLYLLAGFAGNVASFAMTQNNSYGASTAIFGLIAAEGIFLYQNRRLFGNTAKGMLTNVIGIALLNLLFGFMPGIDNWGHIGGLLGGLLFAWFAGPKLTITGIYPLLSLTDQRDSRQVWLAAAGVAVLFGALAFAVIILSA